MFPHKKTVSKSPTTKASTSEIHWEEEENTPGSIYDETMGFIEKGNSIKWDEFFQMFKTSFPIEEKDEDKFKVFRNIRKSRLHRVETHTTIFPCVDVIS
jgi:hypothetical protein